jgi:diguanylate cyclase (GGDEF)-like protein
VRVRKDGGQIPVSLTVSPVKNTAGEIIGASAIARDTTERKKAEKALQQANAVLMGWLKELEKRTQESSLLNDMGDLLQTCVSAEEAYAVIVRFFQQLFQTESGALCVFHSSENLVDAVAVWGPSPIGERVFAPEECWALRRGQMHVVEDPVAGPVCPHLGGPPQAGYLCIPMVAQGEALGVLHLQAGVRAASGEGRLNEAKQRLAETVAGQIALSLANLRLRETLRLQSIRDSLTGLFNRRYMEESLARELRRAARNQRSLGAIMLDLDHFKRFNDTFGHEAGDTLLRELGEFLRTRTRREDIACRYGGEEFAVILPEASIEATQHRAERLRAEFKHLNVQHRGQSLGTVTLSLGVAVFPEHGTTFEEILRVADRALYRAKEKGRDRVVVGEPSD